jgi:DNA-binding NtrC family response regulator
MVMTHPIKAAAPPGPGLDCVFLTSSEPQLESVARLLPRNGIRIHHAAMLEQAEFLLGVTRATVLLTDAEFLDGTWEDAIGLLKSHPEVALVVTSPQADEGFWIDALERGAYDLIVQPFAGEEVRRILENAHIHATRNGERYRTAGG